jgi:hypothetical protein
MGVYPEKSDGTPPSVYIEKPQGGLYAFDKKIIPLSNNATVILGDITMEILAEDYETDIDRLEIWVDGNLKNSSNEKHYYWLWDEVMVGRHMVRITAWDNAGNCNSNEFEVFIINF